MVRFIRLLLNEKGRFLWSAHRITERQKAGKARSIKGKQLKNSRNTASRPPAARLSSASAEFFSWLSKERRPNGRRSFSEPPGGPPARTGPSGRIENAEEVSPLRHMSPPPRGRSAGRRPHPVSPRLPGQGMPRGAAEKLTASHAPARGGRSPGRSCGPPPA